MATSRKLKVTLGEPDDNSVIYISTKTAEEMSLFRGDTVRLKGKTKSSVLVLLCGDDRNDDEVAMNRCAMKNIGLEKGDYVELSPEVDIQYGTRVHILPTKESVEGITGDIFEVYLKPYFLEAYRPVTEGDIFRVNGGTKALDFVVMDCEPGKSIIVAPDTVIFCDGDPVPATAAAPPASWDDFIGYATIKRRIKQLIDAGTSGKAAVPGILLTGPGGSGKTFLCDIAKVYTNTADCFVILMDTTAGVNSDLVASMFKSAKENTPCLIVIENLDKFAPPGVLDDGARAVREALSVGIAEVADNDQVMVLATARYASDVDAELRAPHRLGVTFNLTAPTQDEALEMLRCLTADVSRDPNVNLPEVASSAVGMSMGQLKAIVSLAVAFDDGGVVRHTNLMDAVSTVRSSAPAEDVREDAPTERVST